jgi:hypothetical protein
MVSAAPSSGDGDRLAASAGAACSIPCACAVSGRVNQRHNAKAWRAASKIAPRSMIAAARSMRNRTPSMIAARCQGSISRPSAADWRRTASRRLRHPRPRRADVRSTRCRGARSRLRHVRGCRQAEPTLRESPPRRIAAAAGIRGSRPSSLAMPAPETVAAHPSSTAAPKRGRACPAPVKSRLCTGRRRRRMLHDVNLRIKA